MGNDMFWDRLRVLFSPNRWVRVKMTFTQIYAQEDYLFYFYYHFGGHLENDTEKSDNKKGWKLIANVERHYTVPVIL